MTYDHIASSFYPKRITELFEIAPFDANNPKKLSKLTGISLEDIELMEAGKLEPTLNMAYKLAAAFQIPLDNLFADKQKVSTDIRIKKKRKMSTAIKAKRKK